jgi:predicted permease
MDPRAVDSIDVIGILAAGTSIEMARAELVVLERRMAELDPRRDPRRRLVIADARGIHPGLARHIGPFALAMMAIVGVVLLIVCANVSGLLLARASARRSEIAIRLAVGASRGRVSRLLLVESGLLAVAGAAAGILLAFWAVRSTNALTLIPGPTGTPVFFDLRLNMRVLAFTAAVTVITTIVFGLLPALQGTRVDLMSSLKDPQSAPGRRRARLRSALVVAQVAVSVALLVGAVLLVRSVRNSARLDLGFDPDGVGVVSFNLQMLGYDRLRSEQFYGALLERTRALPGVERAALATFVPMAGSGDTITVLNPQSTLAEGGRMSVAYNRVSDDYFATVRQPLVRGREFTPRDRPGAPVVIVNETLARRLFGDGDAIGRRIRIVGESGDAGTEREVIGIAQDARYGSFGGRIGPFVFLPALEGLGRAETLHIRASSPQTLTTALSATAGVARALDPLATPKNNQSMREAMSFALIPALVAETVLGVAAVIALLLASGGLYGLICYTLQQRVKEIGVRVALGATREQVFRLIVGGSIRLTIVGAAAGLLIAAGAMRLLSSLLIGLRPTDPLTFAGVGAAMLAVSLTAGYVAARKGLAIDPVVVLKHE